MARGDELIRRKQRKSLHLLTGPARHRIQLADRIHLIPPELNPDRCLHVRGKDIHDLAPHPESAPLELDIVAVVKNLNQTLQKPVPADLHPYLERNHHLLEILRRPQTVNAGHTRHHDHIPPADQGAARRNPQSLNLLIDRRILFNEGIRLRNISLRLIVVVVAHKVFNRVVREKCLELRVQLGRKRLIVRNH
ncbi:MAG: hypothetical protein BWY82_01565 [Verrucomicrobia bacterium ADurb.Bin474]|nr:MAG: hypothetical protein BWY82_01565 [Verrucomicrobia bacterium ADurb.Bin474]